MMEFTGSAQQGRQEGGFPYSTQEPVSTVPSVHPSRKKGQTITLLITAHTAHTSHG